MEEKSFAEIPFSEYQERTKKLKELMDQYEIDGLLLFCRENQTYYAGWRDTWDHNFLVALVVPRDGDPALIGPGHIEGGVRKYTYVENIRVWEELKADSDPITPVVDIVREMGFAHKTIGLELGEAMFPNNATPSEIASIRERLPEASFLDAAPMIWTQRKIKTAWEIDLMRDLGKIVANGFKAGLEATGEGISELDVQQAIWDYFMQAGIPDTMMQGGVIIRSHPYEVYTPAFTGRATARKFEKGDQLMLDGGPTLKGYFTDIQRQAVIGPPSDLQKRLNDLAEVGFEAALPLLKPGTAISELWRVPLEAQRKHDSSYSPKWKFVGHNIGLRIHEPPALTEHEQSLLEPGMIVTLEVAGYDIPKWRVMGAFPEDMILITETGHENLTSLVPRGLWVR
jgi:Xaa-Pro aminopeptidase